MTESKGFDESGSLYRSRMARSLLINGALPLAIYLFLKNELHVPEITALLATSIPPLLASVIGILRHGRIDFIAGVVLLSIGIGLALALLGGTPRLFLIRESFFTAAFGLAFLVSLLLPRPLAYYTGRWFMAAGNPALAGRWPAMWAYPAFRKANRVQSVIWGIGLLAEAAVRTWLVLTLPIPQFLAISPFILWGILGATFAASQLHIRRWRARYGPELGRPA